MVTACNGFYALHDSLHGFLQSLHADFKQVQSFSFLIILALRVQTKMETAKKLTSAFWASSETILPISTTFLD